MLTGTPTLFSVVFTCSALLGTATVRAQICELSPDGSACVPLACSPIPEDQCIATVLHLDRTTGAITPIACKCMDFNACHVELGNVTPFPVGLCPDGESCTVLGSDFDGDGVDDLFTAHCLPFVPGVCCLDSDGGPILYDTCVPLDEESCCAEGGIFSGVDIVCRDAQACCLPFGTPSICADMSPLCCSASFGIPQGPGSTCAESNDPGGCGQTCGGFAWIDCEDPAQFCKLPQGGCCCDLMGICTPVPSGCLFFLDPVCGCDGVTYSNECEADAAGVSTDHHGPCKQPCLMNEDCPALTQFCKFPEGNCEPIGAPGACTSRPEHCPLFWDPVCGCDGVTYSNECEADRAGVSIRYRSECKVSACCFADGSCLDLPAEVCKGEGGTPLPGTPCSAADCKITRTGACCVHDPTGAVACFVGTEADCVREGGTYQGDGTSCPPDSTEPCGPAAGACCFDIGGIPTPLLICEEATQTVCESGWGVFEGPGTTCDVTEACCLPYGEDYCADIGPRCCAAYGGFSYGPGSNCADVSGQGICGRICGGVTLELQCVDGYFCKFPEGCSAAVHGKGRCRPIPDECPEVYDPVCGCFGVTYANECFADAASVSVLHHGECNVHACCLADGSCLDLPADLCKGEGGTPLPGAPCYLVDCKITATGACCIHDPTGVAACFVGTEADCIREGGTYEGDGTTCLSDVDACVLQPDPGPCDAICPRFFYNTCSGQCASFTYGCCGGNANNFLTREDCEAGCMLDEHVCLLPPEKGPCEAAIPRFYYNACSGRCELFTYGGCDGNANNFETLAECERACPTPGTGACGPLTGACCLADPLTAASCFVVAEWVCRNEGGTYQGDGTACPPDGTVPCGPPTGACCVNDPTNVVACFVGTEKHCLGEGGTYLGDKTTCPSDPNTPCAGPCDLLCPPDRVCFTGCGVLVQGVECVLFKAESGLLFEVRNLGGFQVGDKVFVTGCHAQCATFCMQGNGCIVDNTITRCAKQLCGGPDGIRCEDPSRFCKFPKGTCDDPTAAGVCALVQSGCPRIWDPVCGCDGVTYANECEADAARVSIKHHGECDRVCRPNDAGTGCVLSCLSVIPEVKVRCWSTVLHLDANSNAMRVAACECIDFNMCHIELTNAGPVPVGFCSDGGVCRVVGTDTDGDGKNDTFKAECVPEPRGACCADFDDGPIGYDSCLELPHSLCEAMGGRFHGAGTTCVALEACCVGDYCGENDPSCCVDAGGVPQGRGSTCDAVVGGETCKRVCGGFTGDRCEAGEFCKFPEGICSDAVDHTGFCAPIPDECPEIYDPVCGCDGLTYDNECFSDAAGVSVLHRGECGRPCDGLGPHPPCDDGQFCKHELGQCSPANKGICTPMTGGCPRDVDPVCGCDGVTYVNDCEAGAAGASIAHWGECKWVCCDPHAAPPCIEGPFCCADGNWSCGDGGGGTTCDKLGVACGPVCGGVKGLPCYDQNTFCKFPQGTCGVFDIFGMCVPRTDGCLMTLYDPVCGCDGVTYGNECEADAAGVSIKHRGECVPTCEPTDDGSGCTHPVCSPVLETDCFSTVLHLDVVTGKISVVACDCMHIFGPCYVALENGVPVAVGTCLKGEACELITHDTNGDGIDDRFMAKCVLTGACCEDITDGLIPYESCSDTSRDSCKAAGGIFHGTDTSCSKVQACCLGDGLCQDMSVLCCIDSGGVPGGHGTTCTDIGGCERICGGIAGIPCQEGELCNLPVGKCCCDIQGVCIPIPNECPDLKEPVCGCDGVTYVNECEAHRAGVSIDHPGECVLCPATRVLADPEPAYCPGIPRTVRIMLTPHDGVTVVALEDSPPAGWIVDHISDEGTFDAVHGKVKWGPFFAPSIPATVSYDVSPLPNDDGLKCFTGTISIDGFNRPMCGDQCLERFCCPHMDADVPRSQCADCAAGDCTTCQNEPCGNRRVTLCELIGYACAWMRGCNDDMAGMTRAAYIWRNGECYCWDDTTNNWFPVSCENLGLGCCAGDNPMGDGVGSVAAETDAAGRATALVPPLHVSRYGKDKGFEVPITIEAPAGTTAVALECQLPKGWKVTRISDGGKWDAQHRKVKWGPFFDDLSRTFTFSVHRIRSAVRSDARRSAGRERFDGFSGTVSFDGVNHPIVIE